MATTTKTGVSRLEASPPKKSDAPTIAVKDKS